MSFLNAIFYFVKLIRKAILFTLSFRANIEKISDIYVTLDSHHRDHIAHARSWNSKADGSGEHPAPFTLISNADVIEKRWFPTDPTLQVLILS